jgi:hypothetical protein
MYTRQLASKNVTEHTNLRVYMCRPMASARKPKQISFGTIVLLSFSYLESLQKIINTAGEVPDEKA